MAVLMAEVPRPKWKWVPGLLRKAPQWHNDCFWVAWEPLLELASAAGFLCRSQWIRHIAFLVFPQTSDAFVSWEGHTMELLLLDHVYG